MNNDYLWDRTGTDPEIESLEAQLEGLRFRPTEPPTAPARAIVLEPSRPNWLLRLGLGFATASAACVALIFALLPTGQAPTPVAAVNVEEPPPAVTKTESRPAPSPDVEYVKASATPQRKPKPKKRTKREAKFAPVPEQPRPLPETFTAEERDAYRQLMTALAVTSENLNIVREKLNSTDKD